MTKLLTLGTLFLTAVRAVVLAKLVLLNILSLISFILELRAARYYPLTSFILALRVVLVAKLIISVILSLIFFILALYTSFLRTSFLTTSFSLLQLTGTGTNLSTST